MLTDTVVADAEVIVWGSKLIAWSSNGRHRTQDPALITQAGYMMWYRDGKYLGCYTYTISNGYTSTDGQTNSDFCRIPDYAKR